MNIYNSNIYLGMVCNDEMKHNVILTKNPTPQILQNMFQSGNISKLDTFLGGIYCCITEILNA